MPAPPLNQTKYHPFHRSQFSSWTPLPGPKEEGLPWGHSLRKPQRIYQECRTVRVKFVTGRQRLFCSPHTYQRNTQNRWIIDVSHKHFQPKYNKRNGAKLCKSNDSSTTKAYNLDWELPKISGSKHKIHNNELMETAYWDWFTLLLPAYNYTTKKGIHL